MANLTIVDKILEILRANLCSIERSENTVVIYKRPQSAVKNNFLEVRTEFQSPRGANKELSTQATENDINGCSKIKEEKGQFKWTPEQENRLFFLCLKGASRKL